MSSQDIKKTVSPEDQAALDAAGKAWVEANKEWEAAKAANDQAKMDYYQNLKDKAHNDAEAIRIGNYGYSGGADGSARIPTSAGSAASSAPSSSVVKSGASTSGSVSQDMKNEYTPVGPGDGAVREEVGMSPEDQAALNAAGSAWIAANKEWEAAKAANNQAQMDYYQALKDKAHADAEAVRNRNNYSGGADGSEYIEIPQKPVEQPPKATVDYDLSEYLKQASAAQIEAQLAALKDAYEKSAAGYDAKLEKLPQTYDAARNNAAAQDAIARKSFDERAAASGLNSGTMGQVELARSSAYQRDIADIDQQQANAVSEIELAKADLRREYENAIAQAKATGSAELANALYQELLRVQGLEQEDAQLATAQKSALAQLNSDDGTAVPSPVSDPAPSPLPGYDNGTLSEKQVQLLQGLYGLAQDGKWGPNSQKVSGLSADEAWAQYLSQKYGADPAPTPGSQDTSAYWSGLSSGYREVLADVQELARDDYGTDVIGQVIAAARSSGYITQREEEMLKAAYGLAG